MYPAGFDDEAMAEVRKKHNVAKLSEFARQALTKKSFTNTGQVLDDIVKIVTRSSMISMFEKPKFRDFVSGLGTHDRGRLAAGYQRLLHGSQRKGFDEILAVLSDGKLAKWSLMTIVPYHYRPTRDVFVKPTTTKNAIRIFELQDLEYKPRPSWDFYERYRATINDMKQSVHPSLSPNNAAFTGFLMMMTGERTG